MIHFYQQWRKQNRKMQQLYVNMIFLLYIYSKIPKNISICCIKAVFVLSGTGKKLASQGAVFDVDRRRRLFF